VQIETFVLQQCQNFWQKIWNNRPNCFFSKSPPGWCCLREWIMIPIWVRQFRNHSDERLRETFS
jgi:hypothetical protein